MIVRNTLIALALAAVTAPAFAAVSSSSIELDAPVTRGEASEDRTLRHVFDRYDGNNDGQLDDREVAIYEFERRNGIVGPNGIVDL